MKQNTQEAADRVNQLKKIAETYFNALRNKTFDTIPYGEKASLRAPLTPGGVKVPLQGITEIREKWWAPLEPALDGITINILGHYIHEDLSGIISEAEITLKTPEVILRVADRFSVNEEGEITEQENHFDPRDVTG